MANTDTLTVRLLDEPEPVVRVVTGRDAWALRQLIQAGATGCTPLDHPGPRWSGYVHKLRKLYGIGIETVHERHGGPFPGRHARYVLRSRLVVVVDHDARQAA